MVQALSQADLLQTLERTGLAFGTRHTRIQQRQFHVVLCSGARQQIELLKHKADEPIADGCELIPVHGVDRLASQPITPAAGLIKTSHQIHERRFARSAGAHDRNELAGVDRQGELA